MAMAARHDLFLAKHTGDTFIDVFIVIITAEQYSDALAFLRYAFQRTAEGPAGATWHNHAADITQSAGNMHSHQRGFVLLDITHGECQVSTTGNGVLKSVQCEVAVFGSNLVAALFDHSTFVGDTVVNQVNDGTDFQAMLFCKHFQIRTASHGAVLVHDFNNGSGRSQPCQTCQVTARFSMAGATQHTTRLSHDRENMTRLHDILRAGITSNCNLDGARAVCRRNTGGHTGSSFNRYGKTGVVGRVVLAHHQRQ